MNALVPLDNAIWQLYARENGTEIFTDIIPAEYKAEFTEKHEKLCTISLITYGLKERDS